MYLDFVAPLSGASQEAETNSERGLEGSAAIESAGDTTKPVALTSEFHLISLKTGKGTHKT